MLLEIENITGEYDKNEISGFRNGKKFVVHFYEPTKREWPKLLKKECARCGKMTHMRSRHELLCQACLNKVNYLPRQISDAD